MHRTGRLGCVQRLAVNRCDFGDTIRGNTAPLSRDSGERLSHIDHARFRSTENHGRLCVNGRGYAEPTRHIGYAAGTDFLPDLRSHCIFRVGKGRSQRNGTSIFTTAVFGLPAVDFDGLVLDHVFGAKPGF